MTQSTSDATNPAHSSLITLHSSLPPGLPTRQARLLHFLAGWPSIRRSEYQLMAGIGHNTAHQDIQVLLALGLIRRLGAGPATRYCRPEQPENAPNLP